MFQAWGVLLHLRSAPTTSMSPSTRPCSHSRLLFGELGSMSSDSETSKARCRESARSNCLNFLCLHRLHFDLRTGRHTQGRMDASPCGVIVELFKFHPGRQPVVLRVPA